LAFFLYASFGFRTLPLGQCNGSLLEAGPAADNAVSGVVCKLNVDFSEKG